MAKVVNISVRKFDYCRAEGWVPEIKISERCIRFDPAKVLKAFAERYGKPTK